MESNYCWVMFTHAMDFFQKTHKFEEVDSKTSFHKFTQ